MSTRFIVPPAPSPLPPAPALSLLPFSLGPQHAPYTDKHANTAHYFQPRPLAPPAHSPGADQQQLVRAAFRGRQVVGQYLSVPPAYRGIILSTTLPPNKGGTEDHTHSIPASAPPTPASIDGVDGDGGGKRPQRKSVLAKIKGAGQTALAKPRTRRTAPAKKRTRLDSDDEQNEEGDGDGDGEETARTPSKRFKSTTTTPKRTLSVPEIVIQEATPLKQPPIATPTTATTRQEGEEEPFIPSPETENDPPAFNISPPPHTLANKNQEEQTDDDGPVRILYPTAEFQGFMLYSGDVPLTGFRSDELEEKYEQGDGEARKKNESRSESQPESQSQSQSQSQTPTPESGCATINLRPSWWRHDGAGEGGDEFVRGMGEWLGLVEVVSPMTFICIKLTLFWREKVE